MYFALLIIISYSVLRFLHHLNQLQFKKLKTKLSLQNHINFKQKKNYLVSGKKTRLKGTICREKRRKQYIFVP
jgi:hypothetical protein